MPCATRTSTSRIRLKLRPKCSPARSCVAGSSRFRPRSRSRCAWMRTCSSGSGLAVRDIRHRSTHCCARTWTLTEASAARLEQAPAGWQRAAASGSSGPSLKRHLPGTALCGPPLSASPSSSRVSIEIDTLIIGHPLPLTGNGACAPALAGPATRVSNSRELIP